MNIRQLLLAIISIFLIANLQNCSTSNSEEGNTKNASSSEEVNPDQNPKKQEDGNTTVLPVDAEEGGSIEEKTTERKPSIESDIQFIR